MFSMWMRLASQSALLALESRRVIARRMVMIAAGNSRPQAEAPRPDNMQHGLRSHSV